MKRIISYEGPTYSSEETIDNNLDDIFWWKNAFHFDLYGGDVAYESYYVKGIALSININTARKKITFDSYDTKTSTFLLVQDKSFSIITLLSFIIDTLKIHTVSFVLCHKRYLNAKIHANISNLLDKRLVDMYNNEFKNSKICE
jgi:hypothetical protein